MFRSHWGDIHTYTRTDRQTSSNNRKRRVPQRFSSPEEMPDRRSISAATTRKRSRDVLKMETPINVPLKSQVQRKLQFGIAVLKLKRQRGDGCRTNQSGGHNTQNQVMCLSSTRRTTSWVSSLSPTSPTGERTRKKERKKLNLLTRKVQTKK